LAIASRLLKNVITASIGASFPGILPASISPAQVS